ncbi:hypothetical protein TNIN_381581 [Trichonephila inaurata madagascariensis]|uniref:Uncharacterized protein n=1 Tax=Trichonephila inaurata madagascariensis TaxID=2747483 RepID=A0A8X6YWD7_9ARAC|nr:hypothetical protein TNIN_381581 [Trichonephila inaurata madagascariensis]
MKSNDCLSIRGVPLATRMGRMGRESIKSDPISGWPNSSCCVRSMSPWIPLPKIQLMGRCNRPPLQLEPLAVIACF